MYRPSSFLCQRTAGEGGSGRPEAGETPSLPLLATPCRRRTDVVCVRHLILSSARCRWRWADLPRRAHRGFGHGLPNPTARSPVLCRRRQHVCRGYDCRLRCSRYRSVRLAGLYAAARWHLCVLPCISCISACRHASLHASMHLCALTYLCVLACACICVLACTSPCWHAHLCVADMHLCVLACIRALTFCVRTDEEFVAMLSDSRPLE